MGKVDPMMSMVVLLSVVVVGTSVSTLSLRADADTLKQQLEPGDELHKGLGWGPILTMSLALVLVLLKSGMIKGMPDIVCMLVAISLIGVSVYLIVTTSEHLDDVSILYEKVKSEDIKKELDNSILNLTNAVFGLVLGLTIVGGCMMKMKPMRRRSPSRRR